MQFSIGMSSGFGRRKVVGLKQISQLLYTAQSKIPGFDTLLEYSLNGVYLGNTKDFSIPFFLDFSKLINPHVFICGATGAGKTYLLRNLALKLAAIYDASLLIIDFTGEYAHLFDFADAYSEKVQRADLSGFSDEEKVLQAKKLISNAVKQMRKGGIKERVEKFIIIDEAWKLLENDASFSSIIREGRKYGVGMLLASQLISDIDLKMLDNVATVFVFKLQNKQSVISLLKNYGLGEYYYEVISNMGVGSALMISAQKDGRRNAVLISRISGVANSKSVRLLFNKAKGKGIGDEGGEVYVEVSIDRFTAEMNNLCGERAKEIMSIVQNEQAISLPRLVAMLLEMHADKLKVVDVLRKFGIADSEIADAFAYALSVGGKA